MERKLKETNTKRFWLFSLVFLLATLIAVFTVTVIASARTEKFANANLTLTSNIDILFWADIDEATAKGNDTYVTFNGGEPVRYDGMRTADGVSYAVYRFEGVLPQNMKDTVTARLYVRGELTDTRTYSVRDYCTAALNNSSSSTALKTLVSDLLVYGAAAQSYLGEGENYFVTNGVEGLTPSSDPTKLTTLTSPSVNDDLSREEKASVKVAGLVLSNRIELYFDIVLPSGADPSDYTARLMLNGRMEESAIEEVDGVYRAYFSDILASEIFTAGKVGVYENGKRISRTVSYSIADYIATVGDADSTDPALKALVRALYCYGISIHKYVDVHNASTPGTVTVTSAGSSSKDANGYVKYVCRLCGASAGKLIATHIRRFDTSNSDGAPANDVSGQTLFTLTTAQEANGNKYYSVIHDEDENLGVGALGYYFTKAQSSKASTYMDSTGQYKTKAFMFSFDVKAPEAGIVSATFNLQNAKTSGTGRWGAFLTIGANGDITGNGMTIAPSGTVNSNDWTSVTVMIEFTELNGENVIFYEFFVNGVSVAITYTPNTMYNYTFTQMHMGMSSKDAEDGTGLYFDNFVFAQGVIHSFEGTPAEYIEKSDRAQLYEIMDMIDAGFSLDAFSTVVNGYDTEKDQVKTEWKPEFESLNTTQYADPLAYPTAGQHPRLLFNESDIPGIIAAMEEPENQAAKLNFMQKVSSSTNGCLPTIVDMPLTGGGSYNYNANVLGVIEAKALYYALYKDSTDPSHSDAATRGYQAIYAIKNYLLTLDIRWKASDQCRLYGHVMYSTAIVYDWCYDLLTEADRAQLMLGVQNLCCAGTSNYPSLSTHNGIKLEAGFPPQSHKQTPITGHGAEFQILRDYFAFAIAIYDENDTWYDNIGGLIYQDYVPVRDYFYTSNFYPDGSAVYNNYRFMADLWNAWLFKGMGVEIPYNTEDMQTVIHGLISMETYGHNQFATGDGSNGVTIGSNVGNCALVSSYLFEDGVARAIAMELHSNYTAFDYHQSGISAANYLILSSNGVKTADDYQANVKNVAYHEGFQQQIIARSGKDANDPVVLMQGAQHLPGGHTHQNGGNFQIYYKGQLTRDDGLYDSYGFNHHYYYHMSTTAHNGVLVYNPSLASTMNGFYNGGQRRDLGIPYNYESWLADSRFSFGKNIGMQTDSVDAPTYVYFANDLTNAYDAVTIDYVERSFLTVFTGDETVPMVLFVFDHIDADSGDYKKTFLLQCVTEPVVDTANKTVKITNTGGGMLVLNSLKGADSIKAFGRTSKNGVVGGGDGSERFWLSGAGKNLPPAGAEGGSLSDKNTDNAQLWGHIEISPNTGNKESLLMNVLYVTDAGTTVSATPTLVEATALTGASFMNHTAMFLSDPSYATSALSFTATGSGTQTYYIGGLNEGKWNVSINGTAIGSYDVTADGRMLTFEGAAGTVTLTPANVRPLNTGSIRYNLNGGTLPKDAPTYFSYGEVTSLPTATKSGMAFDGWFLDKDLTQPIHTIGSTVTDETVTLYAKWVTPVFDVDYTNGGSLNDYKNLAYGAGNGGDYGTATYSIVTGEDGSYLLMSSTGATPQILKSGAFQSLLNEGVYAVSYTLTLSKDGTNNLQKTLLYIRDMDTAKKDFHLLWIAENGEITLGTSGSNTVIGKVTADPTTIRLTLDFASAMLYAYDANGNLLGAQPISTLQPLPEGYASYAEWFDAFTESNNYMLALSAKGAGNLRVYGMQIAPKNIFAACRHMSTNTTAHTWDGGTVITAPSTTSCTPGITRYRCTVCGITKDVQVASAISHTFVYGNTAVTDGACEQSSKLYYTCKTCGCDILFANVKNVQTYEGGCSCADLVGASPSIADYSGNNLALVGAFNPDNIAMTSNLDVRMLGASSPSTGSLLANSKVAVLGFDVIMPSGGFSESSINLNAKLNGTWVNTGLKLSGSKLTFSASKGSYSKTMTAGVAVNVVVMLDISTPNVARYDYWINGEYRGYKTASYTSGEANFSNAGNTYVNLTISRTASNKDATRGMILDNLFIADELPVGFTKN